MTVTDPKDPEEDVPFTADFTSKLARLGASVTISSIISVSVTVVRGSGSSSGFLSGSAAISSDNKQVTQLMTGGSDGSDYKIRVRVLTSSNNKLVIAGVVPVRSK